MGQHRGSFSLVGSAAGCWSLVVCSVCIIIVFAMFRSCALLVVLLALLSCASAAITVNVDPGEFDCFEEFKALTCAHIFRECNEVRGAPQQVCRSVCKEWVDCAASESACGEAEFFNDKSNEGVGCTFVSYSTASMMSVSMLLLALAALFALLSL